MDIIGYITENLLYRIKVLFYKQYHLKVDDYFYDYDKNLYIVVLRFRNKHAIMKSSIIEIVKDKKLINSLHPYDGYLIGMLSSMQEKKFIMTKKMVNRDYEDYYVIEPCVDWVGMDILENALIFQPRESVNKISISVENFCKDLKLMRAISSASTFLIGTIVTDTFLKNSIF